MGTDKFVSDLKPDAEIFVTSIAGDLVIEGSVEAGLKVRGDNPRLNVESDGSRVTVSANGDCRLRVPVGVRLHVDSVDGDAMIKMLEAPLTISHIGGDLTIRDTASIKIKSIGGDLELKRINGKAHIASVGGDFNVLGISDVLSAHSVGGDVLIKGAADSCTIDSIGSDLVLNIDFNPASRYEFSVGNDVLGRVPAHANVRFTVPENTETMIEIPGVRSKTDGDNDIYIVGDGDAKVQFKVVGNELKLVDSSFGDSMDEIFETAVPDDLDEVINARISEQIEAIQDRLHRETDKIRRHAERTAERVKQHAARSRSWGFQWDFSDKPKRGGVGFDAPNDKAKREMPSEPVTDQERMAILKMVEEKKITVEEAARLLSALEGSD
jgi:hypothetical protein